MISKYPHNPLKGRGAVRIKVDCRKRANRERVELVKKYFQSHYIAYGHGHYISPEAIQDPIDSLRAVVPIRGRRCGMSLQPMDQFLKDVKKSATKHFLKNENQLPKDNPKNQATQ